MSHSLRIKLMSGGAGSNILGSQAKTHGTSCKAQGYVRIVAVEILLMLSGLINHLSTEVFCTPERYWIACVLSSK